MKEFTFFNHSFRFLSEERQWEKLQVYLNHYFFGNHYGKIGVALLLLAVLGFLLSLVSKRRTKKAFNLLSLLIYCGGMALLFVVGRDTVRGIRVFNVEDYITPDGFHETRILISLINCLMFVPFGILLRKVSGRGHAILNVCLVLLTSVAIEVAQYGFAKGFFSLEDILMYLVGGFAGIILASPFCLVAQYLEERKRKPFKEIRYHERDF